MSNDILVSCENVSKKFCRGLKRSLWYGVQDIWMEINPRQSKKPPTSNNSLPALRKDEFWAVNNISFELKRGECLGLIGHNGAGKSTLLKMLNGLIKPDHGRITMKGRIGALIELNAGFNPILTGRENVYIYGSILGFTKKEIDAKYNDIVQFAEMKNFMEMPFRSYSSGMKVRLGFAVAAQMEPDVLIIDEVLAVGDAGFRIKCLNRIHELLLSTAVIFVSHSIPAITRISNRIAVINQGACIFESDDVDSGVNKYIEKFKTQMQQVVNSRDIKINNILFNGKIYKTPPTISLGDNIYLHFDLTVKASCKTIGAKIFITNQELRPIVTYITNKFEFFKWDNHNKKSTLKVCLTNLCFSSGRYSINIELFDHDSMVILSRTENVILFTMGHHIPIGCDSIQVAEWSISS